MSSKRGLREGPKLVAVVGPTGVGKTEVGIRIAETFGGEVVNFDSVQLYKHLRIGAAKPSSEEMSRVPHHLFDVLELYEPFNAAEFVKLADAKIREIRERGNLPVLVGGTGLYLKALVHGLFPVEVPDELREELKRRLSEEGLERLYSELKKLDPEAALKIHPNDRIRVLRALEVFYATGRPFSYWVKKHSFSERRYEVLKVGLVLPREELYRRLNERVDRMIKEGLLEEVRELLEKGYDPSLKPLRSIGYRHMVDYLLGRCSFEDAVRRMKRDTRAYAKRQLTWFKADPEVKWFSPNDLRKILKEVEGFLALP